MTAVTPRLRPRAPAHDGCDEPVRREAGPLLRSGNRSVRRIDLENLMRKLSVFLVSAGAAAGVLTPVGPATAAPATPTAWGACATGNVCFYTGAGGTGSKCSWSIADPDWTSGSSVCSWATTRNVKSVWNRGTSSATGVAYYLRKNYGNRVGCTRQGARGNLMGTYKVLSHRWVSGSCG